MSTPAPSPPPGDDDEPVPRLPRGRGIKLSFAEILRIAMIATMLVALLVLRKPCAESTGRFIESFEPPVDAGLVAPRRALPPGEYIQLSGDMSEDELREKLELVEGRDAGAGAAVDDPEAAPDSETDSEPAPGR